MIKKCSRKIAKPWGYELILTPSEAPATAKILHINAGCRLSLQYHEVKEETLILIQGEAKIIYGDRQDNLREEPMIKNVGFFISKGVIHRPCGITDCDIFESSTPERGTTIRLQDDYGRSDETEEERERERKT